MRPQKPSQAPAVIDKVLELLEASVADEESPLHGVQVIDGPVLNLTQIEDDAIAIGPGTEDVPGFTSTWEQLPGAGRAAYAERIELGIALASYRGDVNMKARRDRAAELLAGLKAVIDANQVVANVWDSAALGPEMSWYPRQIEAGATVEVGLSLVFRSIV